MKKWFLPSLLLLLVASLFLGCQGKDSAVPKPEETAQVSLPPQDDGVASAAAKTDGPHAGGGETTTPATGSAATDGESTDDDGNEAGGDLTIDDQDADAATDDVLDFLDVGDPAPPLDIASWVKGEPISVFDNGQVYVVEFWATWCGPCKASMPHLADLQDKYGDQVVFIGVSDEQPETVEGFLESPQSEDKTWNEVVSYRLAMDAEEKTTQAYLRAAGENGIPTAFVVGRQGTLEWIGHPMGIDQALSKIVDGSWDTDAFLAKRTNEKQAERERMAAMSKINVFIEEGNWDGAIGVVDQLLDSFKDDTNLMVSKFELLWRGERIEEAYRFADEIAQANWDNYSFLNGFAWAIATEVPEHARDLQAALRYALRSNELTEDGDGSVLDTIARVQYELGNLAEAVAWQEKAVAAEPGIKALGKSLEKYQAELAAVNSADAGLDSATDDSASDAGM